MVKRNNFKKSFCFLVIGVSFRAHYQLLNYNSIKFRIPFLSVAFLISVFFINLYAFGELVYPVDTNKYCKGYRLSSESKSFTPVLDSLEILHKEWRKKLSNKDIKDAYKSVYEQQQGFINSSLFLFDRQLYPKVNKILQRIKKANPQYQTFNHVLISRSRVPNAYCYGNGIIVINLGMMSLLKNEAQLAALLGHEFAHHALKHMEKGILYKKAHQNDKEVKKKRRKINRSEYEQNARYEQYRLENAMVYRAQNRFFESQADSLSIELLKNTTYDASESLSLLNILNICDQEKYNVKLDYVEIFSNGEYVLDNKRLLNKEGMELEEIVDPEIINALKTHPDCKERIKNIVPLINGDTNKEPHFEVEFELIGKQSDYEMLYHDIESKRFALCIKNALLLNHAEYDPLLNIIVANCLAEIYFAQKDHLLWNYLPMPDEDFQWNYHQLLVIIENIRLSELKQLANAFIEKVMNDKDSNALNCDGYLDYLKLQKKCISENRMPTVEEKTSLQRQHPTNSFLIN